MHLTTVAVVTVLMIDDDIDGLISSAARLSVSNTPRQPNGYDCGIYVLHNIEHFINNQTDSDYDNQCFTPPLDTGVLWVINVDEDILDALRRGGYRRPLVTASATLSQMCMLFGIEC